MLLIGAGFKSRQHDAGSLNFAKQSILRKLFLGSLGHGDAFTANHVNISAAADPDRGMQMQTFCGLSNLFNMHRYLILYYRKCSFLCVR